MSFRTLLIGSVCSAFLAASAAVTGAGAATTQSGLVAEAYSALQSGDAETAVTSYTTAIESRTLEPEVLANALLNRGLAYQRLNQHEFAIDDYTAAMRIDAMSGKVRALALYNRGLSYQRLGRQALAIEDFTSALFLDAEFSHAYYSRGTLLRDSGQYLFALADFDKALRYRYPDSARVYFAQALTFEKLQRTADARDALTRALVANPSNEPARQRLAVLDGKAQAGVKAAAADQIQTGTLSAADAGLPAARAPGRAGAAGAEPPVRKPKLYTDRVPQEATIRPASAAPEAVPPAKPMEKILAVETVPEDAAGAQDASALDAAPAAASSAPTGWAVQLISATTEEAARAAWEKMQARYSALAGKDAVVVRADLGSKGVFYRVRLVGYDTQSDASSACAKLKAKGVKCYISRAAS